VLISGTVTVRVDWNVPANAMDVAKRVAANPPIQHDAQTVRLRSLSDPSEERAVTISYHVRVPADTRVLSRTESGATTVRGVSGSVTVRTQSGAVELTGLGAAADVTTGSGSVRADGVGGALTVTTGSSAFTGRSLGGHVRIRTTSGAVDADLSGQGDADVETASSAIRISGVRGAVTASSQSGRVTVIGTPSGPWTAVSGSGSLDLAIESGVGFVLDAASGSGSARVDGALVDGSVSKRKVTGQIGSGGPLIHIRSRSGSVRVRIGRAEPR
jgi:DUF4097 and DUF4098 domain-containing protein YvlB